MPSSPSVIAAPLSQHARATQRPSLESPAWVKIALALGFFFASALSPLAVRSAQAAIEFKGPIPWHDWDAGIKQATAKKKPILMLMHTDACPKCTLLGHVFNNNKDVQKLSKGLVMVHIDGGLAPLSLTQRFARFGSYVPKIVFLQPDGTPMEQITSGNGNFPYYFQPSRPDNLMGAMQRAIDQQAALVQKGAAARGALKTGRGAGKHCAPGTAGC